MNETINNIMNRRSTRGFKPTQIKESEINEIISCGLNAPSALNTQGWHFTVVTDAKIIDKLNNRVKELLTPASKERMLLRYDGNENFSIFYDAPTVVVVSGMNGDDYATLNCGLATQNMCIAAESLGVSSCIIGMTKMIFSSKKLPEYIQDLQIPNGYTPLFAVSFGYPSTTMTKPDRLSNKVNFI